MRFLKHYQASIEASVLILASDRRAGVRARDLEGHLQVSKYLMSSRMHVTNERDPAASKRGVLWSLPLK